MSIRTPLVTSFILIAAMIAFSVWGWSTIPAHAQIAVHWDFRGKPNGFLPRDIGLCLLPAIGAAMTLLFVAMPYIEPRRENLAASRKLYVAGWIMGMLVIAGSQALIVLSAAGYPIDVPSAALVMVTATILVTGNYYGKARATYFLGLKTPWVRNSDLSWERTHRLLGRLFVLTAIATFIAWYALGTLVGFEVFALFMTLSAIFAATASYFYWKRDPDKRA